MIVKRVSPYTGVENEMDLPITEQQWVAWLNGELIQNAMPNLSNDEREFILSGLLPGEWDALFAVDGDDEG